jgi:hypothetical protein
MWHCRAQESAISFDYSWPNRWTGSHPYVLGMMVMVVLAIPSGKRLHNYGKSTFLIGKSTINYDFQ